MQSPKAEQQPTDTPQEEAMPPEGELLLLEQELADAQQQRQECADALLRTQADFLNYKRRAVQEQREGRAAAQSDLLAMLLPILDDLARALEATPPELDPQPWVQGIYLVARRLKQTLQQLDVRPIGAVGEPFDPHLHEAIMTEHRADVPAGTVTQVSRPGYTLGERVIRPAQVVVAAAPEQTAMASSES